MEVYVTRHARNRMRLYAITSEKVEQAVARPEHVTVGDFGGRQAWKRRTVGGWLRVIFKDEGMRRVVISVTPRRRGPGGRDAH